MKVAITFIGTNKYLDFLPRYYENIKEYFLPNTEKVFLVFTDGDGDFPDDVKVFEQEHLEWPYICLLYTSPSPRDKRQSRMPSSA